MKKNVLKKLICTVLTAVCVITSVVPAFAEDTLTATEAATKKSVTSVYKYHLESYDKKGDPVNYSKASFYKDLNALPTIGMEKTTINVPALTRSVKSLTKEKDRELYASFIKFKAPKTGTYNFTITNLQGTDDKALRAITYFDIFTPLKEGKKYRLNHVDCYEVGDYDPIWENNYLTKLRTMIDAYKEEHPDYSRYLEKDIWDRKTFMDNYSTNKIKYKVKLKKGQTYVFEIDNAGMDTLGKPYKNDFYLIDQKSCLYGGIYTAEYSFDMEIKLKAKKK